MQTIRNGAQMYRDSTRVQKDATELAQQFPALTPRTEYLQLQNANPVLVLVFNGTIPVGYKGNTYNIPISIRIPPAYPSQPPMVSVVPTAQMVLRQSVNVDASGQFTHLSVGRGWRPFGSLVSVVNVMQNIFGQEPPVYSRSSSQSSNQSGYQPQQLQQQQPQQFPVQTGYNLPSYSSPQQYQQQQSPYQYDKLDMPQPMSLPQNIPPQLSTAQQLPKYSNFVQQSGRQSDPYFTPLSMPDVSLSPKQQLYKQDEDDDAIVLMSLRSALEDKVNRVMHQIDAEIDVSVLKKIPGFNTDQSEMDRLLELNQRLQTSADKQKKDSEQVDQTLQQVSRKLQELDKYLEYQKTMQTVSVDDALVPVIPCTNQSQQSTVKVATQLIDAMCEDATLEDVMYELQRQFLQGQVTEVDAYLKQLRRLGNEQFMARLQVRKIKEACGVL